MSGSTIIDTDDEPIHGFFGLSYCSHLVLPRVLLQSMPAEWQRKLVVLIAEMDAAFADVERPDFYDVRAAVEKTAGELDKRERALAGVTMTAGKTWLEDAFYDRDGNEIEADRRVMVPVADPLPPYSRGRTRVPRGNA